MFIYFSHLKEEEAKKFETRTKSSSKISQSVYNQCKDQVMQIKPSTKAISKKKQLVPKKTSPKKSINKRKRIYRRSKEKYMQIVETLATISDTLVAMGGSNIISNPFIVCPSFSKISLLKPKKFRTKL